MVEVVYYSLTGNTRRVADAIAGELGVVAQPAKTKGRLADESLVFLGAGLYGPLRGWGLRDFIEENEFEGRRVALFGTSGEGKGKELQAIEEAVVARGAVVAGRFFSRGEFLFVVNRKRPNDADLDDARAFAREVVEEPS